MKENNLIDPNDFLSYQLNGTVRLLRNRIQKLLDEIEPKLTPEQFFLLFKLYVNDGQSQRELADKNLNDYPNITRLIDKLEKKGYVYKKTDENDHRIFKVYISEKGKSRIKSNIPLIIRERKILMKGVSPEEEKIFRDVLKLMEKNIPK